MDDSMGDKLSNVKTDNENNENEDLIIRELMDEEAKEKSFLEREEER
jgi:hypothetical protein